MASIFQRGRSKLWVASIRAWDAEKGRWVWLQKPTGTRDRAAAAGIAASLEQASGAAKAGTMTRERALELVNEILRLAGAAAVTPCPSLEDVAKELLDAVDVTEGTARKYAAHWATLEAWAKKRAKAAVSAWLPVSDALESASKGSAQPTTRTTGARSWQCGSRPCECSNRA